MSEAVNCETCCGACCLHLGTPPFHSYEWPGFFCTDLDGDPCPDDGLDSEEVIALFREIADRERGLEFYPDGPCLWLDLETRRCKHYEHRPDVCRSFEVGAEDCRRFRDEAGVGRRLVALPMAH